MTDGSGALARVTDVVSLLATAAAHPDLALAERARSMMDRHGGAPMSLRAEPVPSVVLPATAPTSAPPPIQSSAELAAELVALLDGTPPDPAIAWERMLDGIVRRAADESPAEVAPAFVTIRGCVVAS